MATLFISDLHLSRQRPEKLSLFFAFLEGPAREADALYILGDLFEEFWIGVNDDRAPNQEILTALRTFVAASATRLYLMRGNRDFHINEEFQQVTGCNLIDDPHSILLNDKPVLLMHGDTLCTDDGHYQRWRSFITHPLICWLNLHMPMALRQFIATHTRRYFRNTRHRKPREIMDVSEDTVMKMMRQYNVETLIHGHTHRQAIHCMRFNGTTATRIVLGDWYEQDSVLVADNSGFTFKRIQELIDD